MPPVTVDLHQLSTRKNAPQACTEADVMEPVLTLLLPLSRCDTIYVKFRVELTTPFK